VGLVVATLLSGCAHPEYRINPAPTPADWSLSVIDARPEEEKSSEVLSLIATSTSYGIARMGDDRTVPDRMSYLRAMLNATKRGPHQGSPGRTVTVTNFTIHRNLQEKLRGGLPTPGLVGAALKASESHAGKHQPGGYDLVENPAGINVVVVFLRVIVDGKAFGVRVLRQAPDTEVRFAATPEIWEKAVAEAIDAAIRDIILQAQL
jgi:hypothetical protein